MLTANILEVSSSVFCHTTGPWQKNSLLLSIFGPYLQNYISFFLTQIFANCHTSTCLYYAWERMAAWRWSKLSNSAQLTILSYSFSAQNAPMEMSSHATSFTHQCKCVCTNFPFSFLAARLEWFLSDPVLMTAHVALFPREVTWMCQRKFKSMTNVNSQQCSHNGFTAC